MKVRKISQVRPRRRLPCRRQSSACRRIIPNELTNTDDSFHEEDLPQYALKNLNSLHKPIRVVSNTKYNLQAVPDSNMSSDEAMYDPPSTVKLIRPLQQGTLYSLAATQVRYTSCKFTVVKESMLVQKAYIDGKTQKMLPSSLLQQVLITLSCLPIAGHLAQRCMYNTFQKTSFWPRITADADCIVQNCTSCARDNSGFCGRGMLQLFSATSLLDFIGAANFRPAAKKK